MVASAVITVPGTITNPTLGKSYRDALLDGANGGVKWLFDLAKPFSFPVQSAPAAGAQVKNLDESGNDGTIMLPAGQALPFAGGGLDFSGISVKPAGVTGPASALADLWAGQQYFLVCLYAKLPALADWNTAAGIQTMFNVSHTAGGYVDTAELVNIAQGKVNAGVASLIFNRQKAINANDQLLMNIDPAQHGAVCQVAFWRNAAGQGARVKSAGTTVLAATLPANAANTADFSTKQPRFGVGNPFSGFGTSSAWVKFRLYRGFLENLATSGRDPVTLLDADWGRRGTAFL